MASYRIQADHDLELVRIVVTGEAGLEETKDIITSARRAAAEHRYPLLYDLRDATANISRAEWFYLPRELDVLRNESTLRTRVAALVGDNPAQRAGYDLYEVATRNVGLNVRIFRDETAAIAWLVGK